MLSAESWKSFPPSLFPHRLTSHSIPSTEAIGNSYRSMSTSAIFFTPSSCHPAQSRYQKLRFSIEQIIVNIFSVPIFQHGGCGTWADLSLLVIPVKECLLKTNLSKMDTESVSKLINSKGPIKRSQHSHNICCARVILPVANTRVSFKFGRIRNFMRYTRAAARVYIKHFQLNSPKLSQGYVNKKRSPVFYVVYKIKPKPTIKIHRHVNHKSCLDSLMQNDCRTNQSARYMIKFYKALCKTTTQPIRAGVI